MSETLEFSLLSDWVNKCSQQTGSFKDEGYIHALVQYKIKSVKEQRN
jgi:hypothetical protein